jgi:hypothetical protein
MVILGPSRPFLIPPPPFSLMTTWSQTESTIFSVSTMPWLEPGRSAGEAGDRCRSTEEQAFCSACRGTTPSSAVDRGLCETWVLGCTCPAQRCALCSLLGSLGNGKKAIPQKYRFPFRSSRRRGNNKSTQWLPVSCLSCWRASPPCDSKINPPDGSDHDIALWFAVIAYALQAINLGQVMDDSAVVSVHGGEAVAFLVILALVGRREDWSFPCPGIRTSSGLLLTPQERSCLRTADFYLCFPVCVCVIITAHCARQMMVLAVGSILSLWVPGMKLKLSALWSHLVSLWLNFRGSLSVSLGSDTLQTYNAQADGQGYKQEKVVELREA